MILYTIQEIQFYDTLMRDKVVTVDRCYEEYFKRGYDYIVEQMNLRIGNPNNYKYPIWAWYIYNGKMAKPDLRHFAQRGGTYQMVCLTIDMPDNEVLLSHFDAFHAVLNNRYLSESDEEFDKYENCNDETKKQSWSRIFDTDKRDDNWIYGDDDHVYIQATFWKLELDQVKKVQFYKCKDPT